MSVGGAASCKLVGWEFNICHPLPLSESWPWGCNHPDSAFSADWTCCSRQKGGGFGHTSGLFWKNRGALPMQSRCSHPKQELPVIKRFTPPLLLTSDRLCCLVLPCFWLKPKERCKISLVPLKVLGILVLHAGIRGGSHEAELAEKHTCSM